MSLQHKTIATMKFVITIGLEIHVQLATRSKLFCGCATDFGAAANSRVCPVCAGLPGSLPVLNRQAVVLGIKAALALQCRIANQMQFARKNYFYPDLPKGYQISQYDWPLAQDGQVIIDGDQGEKTIGITRAHLEEDAGKLIHGSGGDRTSYIDLNRAGIPLLEIVSQPDLASGQEAYCYLKDIKRILTYTQISDCNMQEGSLRCDANISVRRQDDSRLGTKVEIKNLNSFNYVRRAIEYEADRQCRLLIAGSKPSQVTMTWIESENRTYPMRSKEYAHDYRYFHEPDLPIVAIDPALVNSLRRMAPELPRQRRDRMIARYGLSKGDASLLTDDRDEADYFEQGMALGCDGPELLKLIKGEIHTWLNEHHQPFREFPVPAEGMAELMSLLGQKAINRTVARQILAKMIATGKPAAEFAQQRLQISDNAKLREICREVIAAAPQMVAAYQQKPQAINSLLGRVMRITQGRADARQAKVLLIELLEESA